MESPAGLQLDALLRERTIAERIAAGKAVEGVEGHPGIKAVLEVLSEAREYALRTLIHAPRTTENVAAVQKQLGVVQGLEAVLEVIPAIRRAAENAQSERDAAVEAADAERQEA